MVIKTENINDGSNSNQATVAKKNSYAAVRQVSPEKVTLVRPGPAAQAQQAQVPVQPGATYQQTRNAAVNVAGRPTPGVKQTVNKVANSIGPALSLNTNQAGIAKTAPQGEFLKPKAGRMATPKIVKPVEAGNAESFLKATAYNAAADLASSAASFADTPDVLNKNLAIAEEIRTPNAGKTQETFLPQLQASNVKAKMSGIADNMSKQSAQYEKNLNGVERFVSRSIAQGVGQLPQMIGNMITPGGADAWIGATSFNRSYNAAKEAKLSTKEALTYAAVVATIEVASNHISSAFKFDSKGLLDEWQEVLVANSGATGSTAFLLKCALDILGEQLEEETATVPEYLLDWYMLGEHKTKGEDGKEHFDVKGLGKEVLDTFIYTFGSTLFLNLVTGGYSGSARDKFLSDLEKYRAPEQVLTLAEAARRYNAATPEQKDLVVNAVAQSSGENPADVKQRIDAAADDIEANSEGTLAREGEQLDKALQDTLSETEAVQTPQNTVIGRDEDLMNGQPAQDDALTNALRVQTDPNYLVDEYNGQQIFRSDYDATPKGQNLKQFGKDIGRNIVVVKNLPNFADGMWYNGKILVSENAFKRGFGKPVAVKHELLHSLRGANVFNDLLSYANSQIKARPDSIIEFDEAGNRIKYSSYEQYMNALVSRYAQYGAYGLENGATWDSVQQNPDLANIIQEEAAAFWVQNNLFQSDDDVKRLVRSSRSTAERIWQALKDMIRQWTGMDDEYTAAIRRAERMFAKALSETQAGDLAPVALDEKQNPQRDYAGQPITPEQAKIQSEIGPMVAFSISTFRTEQAKGRFDATANNGKGGFTGMAEMIAGKDVLRRTMMDKKFSNVQINTVIGFLEEMANYLQDEALQAKYNYIGWQDLEDATVTVRTKKVNGKDVVDSVVVSAMVANGEYPVNFDLTTICNKREGIMQVIMELANIQATDENGVRRSVLDSVKLTDKNMWQINQALKAEGIDTACLGCFVEARRYYTNNFVNKIDEVWNTAVKDARNRLGLSDGDDAYFNFAKGQKPTQEDYEAVSDLWSAYDESTESKGSPAQRIKILMDEIVRNNDVNSPYLKYIQASDVLTPEGIRGFKELSTADRDMVKLLKSIYGTSSPKEILAFTPYNSEIALLPDKIKDMDTGNYLRSIGGIRVQSFSDFKMEHFFDHMQMVADEAARGFPNHGYSKVIAYARLFGLTGRKINMSVMFDVLSAEAWRKMFNCSKKKARELAKKYQGLRFVTEIPANNVDNRPYKPVTIEGVDGYLTYLLSDADAVNSEYERLYQDNLAKGMDPEAARRQANKDKPFEQSINYREAVELENRDGYKNNVGIVAVAYGDEHFRMLLDDPNVRYIIPYHRSGLPKFIAAKTSLKVARDYTMRQNTIKVDNGAWKRKGGSSIDIKDEYKKFVSEHPDAEYPAIDFFKSYVNEQKLVPVEDKGKKLHGTGYDVYRNLDKALDIREVSNEYLEWCIENDYAPVFYDVADHPNYYKVLFDFAVTDADGVIHPQGPVRNIYPGLNLEDLADEIEESGMSVQEFLAANEDRFSDFHAEIERALAEQNAKAERRETGMENVLSDVLSQDSENSIIAGSNIQSIQYGTPDYTSPKAGVGITSLIPDGMFSIPAERYDSFEDVPDDVDDNYGFHAGDLGKSRVDDYAHQEYSRGTGHFGFGTYFTSLAKKLGYGNYAKRPIQSVNFDNYNLFRPRNADGAYKLHQALKVLDGFIEDLSKFEKHMWISGRDISDFDSPAFKEKMYITRGATRDLENITWDLFEGEKPDPERVERVNKFVESLPDSYKEGIEERAKELEASSNPEYGAYPHEYWVYEATAEAVKEYADAWEAEYEKFRDLAFNLESALDYEFSEEEILKALKKTEETIKKYDVSRGRLNAEPGLDSAATVFMKTLGFEGVDVRHIDSFDNTMYGSVIYDLKGRDLERKKANGARFSIPERNRTPDQEAELIMQEIEKIEEEEKLAEGNYLDWLKQRKAALEKDLEFMTAPKQEQEKMRRDHAREAGYDSDTDLYHGTPTFGFTEFKDEQHDVPFIYTSDNSSVAANYAGDNHYAAARDLGRPYDGGSSIESIIRDTESTSGATFDVMTDEDRQNIANQELEEVEKINDKLNLLYNDDVNIPSDEDEYGTERLANAVAFLQDPIWTVDGYSNELKDLSSLEESVRYDIREYLRSALDKVETSQEYVRNYLYEHSDELNDDTKKFLRYLTGYEFGDELINLGNLVRALENKDMLLSRYESLGRRWAKDPDDMREALDSTHNIGAYRLWGNLGENPLEFDAQGSDFTSMPVPQMGDKRYGTDTASKWASENGYSGVKMRNVYDWGPKGNNHVFFRSNDVKLADTMTYDDNGNPIRLSERDDINNPDIRYSMPKEKVSKVASNTYARSNFTEEVRNTVENFDKVEGPLTYVPKAEEESLNNAVERVKKDFEGEMKKLPTKEVFDGEDTDTAMQVMHKLFSDGLVKEAIRWAKIIQQKGTEAGQRIQAFAKYTRTPEGFIVKGERVIGAAIEDWAKENPKLAEKIKQVADHLTNWYPSFTADITTEDGFKAVSDYIQSLAKKNKIRVNKMEADWIAEMLADRRKAEEIETAFDRLQAGLGTDLTSAEIDEIYDAITESQKYPVNSKEAAEYQAKAAAVIARRLNSTFMDKWNAWRYLAMLGNTRTHLRNIMGNAIFGTVVDVKDALAGQIEAAVSKVAPIERTKTANIAYRTTTEGKALYNAAMQDANDIYSILVGQGKYNIDRDIDGQKQIFKFKPLEKLRRLNGDLLEAEDWFALQRDYAKYLSNYMYANHLDPSILTGENNAQAQRARTYAVEAAQKATFRNANAIANALSKFENDLRGSDKLSARLLGNAVEGVLPFKKTPANILERGLEFSPIGLVKAVAEGVNMVNKGKVKPAQFIDTLTTGLTGTSVLALGAYLAAQGLLTGSGDDDDKEMSQIREAQGWKPFALHIGNTYYTLDWLAPAAIPLFIGANLYENSESQIDGLNGLLTALTSIGEPVVEMSMLQGLNDMLDSIKYAKETGNLATMAQSAATSYLQQGIPTVLGQVARSVDPTRRTTSPSATGTEGDLEHALRQTMNKIPGLSRLNEPYLDVWGREQENPGGNVLGRAAYNMLSPGYLSNENYSYGPDLAVEEAYGYFGDDKYLPKKPSHSVKRDGEDVRLTAKEYTEYARTYGQESYKLLDDYLNSDYYEKNPDVLGATIETAYKLAKGYANRAVGADLTKDQKEMLARIDDGTDPLKVMSDYIDKSLHRTPETKAYTSKYGPEGLEDFQIHSDLDGNGSVKREEARQWLDQSGKDMDEQALLWATILSDEAKTKADQYAAAGYDPTDYYLFNMLADPKGDSNISKTEADAYFAGTDLDDVQKELIWALHKNKVEVSENGETKPTSKLTTAQQDKVDQFAAQGYDPESFIPFFREADAAGDGNGALNQAETKAWLDASDLDDVQKALIWNLVWPRATAKNPYD